MYQRMALTATQLRKLRATPVPSTGNRVAAAMDLLELTQSEVGQQVALTQQYVSDVARGRHQTITVENAHKFADLFGCSIEDLFPVKQAVAS